VLENFVSILSVLNLKSWRYAWQISVAWWS